IPSVYAGDAPDALNDVAAYRNPLPTSSGPNLPSGRRHHAYSPTATYDATTRARQIETDFGSTRIGLRATAHSVSVVVTTPATATAPSTSARTSLRRDHGIADNDACATSLPSAWSITSATTLHPDWMIAFVLDGLSHRCRPLARDSSRPSF